MRWRLAIKGVADIIKSDRSKAKRHRFSFFGQLFLLRFLDGPNQIVTRPFKNASCGVVAALFDIKDIGSRSDGRAGHKSEALDLSISAVLADGQANDEGDEGDEENGKPVEISDDEPKDHAGGNSSAFRNSNKEGRCSNCNEESDERDDDDVHSETMWDEKIDAMIDKCDRYVVSDVR